MGLLDIKTAVVIGSFPGRKKRKRAVNVLPTEEIDRLDPGMLSGMNREQLAALRKKLSDTSDELYADCDPGTTEWDLWECRMDRLDAMKDRIDMILEPEVENDWEDENEESD